jgi:hypothetical protein
VANIINRQAIDCFEYTNVTVGMEL